MKQLLGGIIGAALGYGLGVWTAYNPSPGALQRDDEDFVPLLLAVIGGFGGAVVMKGR